MTSLGAGEAAKNLGWLVVERLARLVCNVVVSFVVARHLGAADFGRLSYAFALIAVGLAIAEGGVEGIVRREIIREPRLAAFTLRAAWLLRLAGGVLCYVLLLAWAVIGEPSGSDRALLLLGGLLLFQPALATSDLWLQARLQARLATLAQLFATGVGGGVRLTLVCIDSPLWTFAAATIVESAVAILLLNRLARRAGAPKRLKWQLDAVRKLWGESWPLLFSSFTVLIYMRLDVVMLRQMVDDASAGSYAAAVRLSELPSFLPGAIAASLLPRLLHARAVGGLQYSRVMQTYLDLNAAVAYAIAAPMYLLATWVVDVTYGGAFSDAGPVLAVHAWTLMCAVLGVARGQFCINEGLTRFHLLATASGALANVALNLYLIPLHGAVGAAWATVVAQAFAAWGSSFFYRPVRACALMQTRALLIPFRWYGYLRLRSGACSRN